ncbi:MAG: hypothetical protein AB7P76_09890 [Candidatus Melainabacteria bacterium]
MSTRINDNTNPAGIPAPGISPANTPVAGAPAGGVSMGGATDPGYGMDSVTLSSIVPPAVQSTMELTHNLTSGAGQDAQSLLNDLNAYKQGLPPGAYPAQTQAVPNGVPATGQAYPTSGTTYGPGAQQAYPQGYPQAYPQQGMPAAGGYPYPQGAYPQAGVADPSQIDPNLVADPTQSQPQGQPTADGQVQAMDPGALNDAAKAVLAELLKPENLNGIPKDGTYNARDLLSLSPRFVDSPEKQQALQMIADNKGALAKINGGGAGDLGQGDLKAVQSLLDKGYDFGQIIADGAAGSGGSTLLEAGEKPGGYVSYDEKVALNQLIQFIQTNTKDGSYNYNDIQSVARQADGKALKEALGKIAVNKDTLSRLDNKGGDLNLQELLNIRALMDQGLNLDFLIAEGNRARGKKSTLLAQYGLQG